MKVLLTISGRFLDVEAKGEVGEDAEFESYIAKAKLSGGVVEDDAEVDDDGNVQVGVTDPSEDVNPDWSNKFEIELPEEESEDDPRLSIEIFGVNPPNEEEGEEEPSETWVGSRSFDLRELWNKGMKVDSKAMMNGGVLIAHLADGCNTGMFEFQMKGENLKNVEEGMKMFVKSDPFFVIQRKIKGEWVRVFKSVTEKDKLNPTWDVVTVSLDDLTFYGDLSTPLKLVMYDHESDGNHNLMGRAKTSVEGLLASIGGDSPIYLILRDSAAGRVYLESGEVYDHVDPTSFAAEAIETLAKVEEIKRVAVEKEALAEEAKKEAEEAREAADEAARVAEEKEEVAKGLEAEAEEARREVEELEASLEG